MPLRWMHALRVCHGFDSCSAGVDRLSDSDAIGTQLARSVVRVGAFRELGALVHLQTNESRSSQNGSISNSCAALEITACVTGVLPIAWRRYGRRYLFRTLVIR